MFVVSNSTNTAKTCKALAENKRLAALPEISTLFDAFKADYDKEIEVDVTSASTLTDAQQNELVASLKNVWHVK